MKTSNKITSLLFLATALVTASCTPEETVVENDMTNTAWARVIEYEDEDDDGNSYTAYYTDTIHFETHDAGKITCREETPFNITEEVIPFSYTYTNETKQGALTIHHETQNVTMPFYHNTTANLLSVDGEEFYKITR